MNCRITEVIIAVLVGALSLVLCHCALRTRRENGKWRRGRKEKKSERKVYKRDKEIKEKDYPLSAASSGRRHCAAHAPSVKAVTC